MTMTTSQINMSLEEKIGLELRKAYPDLSCVFWIGKDKFHLVAIHLNEDIADYKVNHPVFGTYLTTIFPTLLTKTKEGKWVAKQRGDAFYKEVALEVAPPIDEEKLKSLLKTYDLELVISTVEFSGLPAEKMEDRIDEYGNN